MEIIVPAVLIGIAALGYVWYASIVGKRNKAREALASVDAHLQQRADLVPNLMRAARRFMEHEKALLTEVTALRERQAAPYDRSDAGQVGSHLAAAEAFGAKLGQLRVAVEAQVTASRRYYNAAVTELNTAVEVWPGSAIARAANVAAMPFYETSNGARAPVNADDYLR